MTARDKRERKSAKDESAAPAGYEVPRIKPLKTRDNDAGR